MNATQTHTQTHIQSLIRQNTRVYTPVSRGSTSRIQRETNKTNTHTNTVRDQLRKRERQKECERVSYVITPAFFSEPSSTDAIATCTIISLSMDITAPLSLSFLRVSSLTYTQRVRQSRCRQAVAEEASCPNERVWSHRRGGVR